MKQKDINPLEALQRIKLMMEYDASKTLSENKIPIDEQSTLTSPVALAGAGLGAVAGAGAGAVATGAAVGSAVPVVGTAIGALVGLGVAGLAEWWRTKDLGKDGFETVISVCKTEAIKNLTPGKLDNQQIRNIAYTIQDAKGDWNDDEKAIENALSEIPTVSDLCKVDKRIPGGLLNFLDSVTDNPKEWVRFTRNLESMIEDQGVILNQSNLFTQDYWNRIFPCVYNTKGVAGEIKKDGKNQVYLIIKGIKDSYRLYPSGNIYHIQKPEKLGTLKCDNNKIVLGESKNSKKLLEQFDDSKLTKKTTSDNQTQTTTNNQTQTTTNDQTQTTTTPTKKAQTYPIPSELKNRSGVVKFQTWVEDTLGKPELLGVYGVDGWFGFHTNNAWNTYKTQYLNQKTSVDTKPETKKEPDYGAETTKRPSQGETQSNKLNVDVTGGYETEYLEDGTY